MICIGRCQKCYIFTLYITDRLWCSARGDDACVLGEGVEGSDSAFVPFLLKIQGTQNLIFTVSYIYALHMNCDTDSLVQDCKRSSHRCWWVDCLTGGDRGGDSFSGRTWDLIWPESSKSFGRSKRWNVEHSTMIPTMPGHQSQGGVYSSKVRQKRLEILGLERQHKQGLTRCGHRRQCARSCIGLRSSFCFSLMMQLQKLDLDLVNLLRSSKWKLFPEKKTFLM